ncbi:DUF2975 domain-containing protein [Marinifilum fragile]|uniref:DUF2975 domain-containing protein n=1 Tax=Marinifilum fragile TaxID=570161 RepID=UPI002AA8BB85|nr:DUF2975 domain-containing protein [Marinifilum fragile]
MKKGIIHSLSLVFKVLYNFSLVVFVATIVGAIIIPIVDLHSISFDIDLHGLVEIPSTISLQNGEVIDGNTLVKINQASVALKSVVFKVLNILNALIFIGCTVWILKMLSEIFDSLSLSVKEIQYFDIANYYKIKKIGFIALGFHIYSLCISICVAWFFIDKFTIAGETVSYYPDLTSLAGIFRVLLIFVIAEVYKAGIQLKEETELTI